MAVQAVFLAKLLARAMPPGAEAAVAEAGVPLFPRPGADLIADCTCTDWASPCKHVVAVAHAVAERLDGDPFLLLSWRGLSEEELLRALRVARDQLEAEGGRDREHVSLEAPAHFWRTPGGAPQLHIFPRAARVPDALLRRLGSPPEAVGGRALLPVLSSFYRQVAKEAERLAYGSRGAAGSG
jgi:uncharacterized Zn finger protein